MRVIKELVHILNPKQDKQMDENQFYGQESPQEVNPTDYSETSEYKSAEYGSEQVQDQQPPAQETSHVLDTLAEKGYDVSGFSNDEQLIRETEARYAASQQAQENVQRHEEWLRYQQAQQAQNVPDSAQPQPDPSGGEGKPEFDPRWSNLVEIDESGNYAVREEYVGTVDPSIADKVNEYVGWRQERSNKLIDNPVDAMMQEGLGDQIDARIQNAVNQQLSKSRVENDAQSFIQQNANVLYVTDPNTGQFHRSSDGQPILSAAGKALNDAHVTLREQGMYDPVARHQVAMQMVQNHLTQSHFAAQQPQQVQNAPQSVSQSYKDQYTDQPFAQPTNPLPPGQMPNTPVQPTANALGANGLPEHNSLGSLATALAVHKGYLQPKS